MDHVTRQQRISDGYEISEKREDRAERHGKSIEEVRALWSLTAKSACCCAECFRPLSPMDSVTMEHRVVAGSARHGNQRWVRVPVCLLCTLNDIRHSFMGLDVFYQTPTWHRARCLNCQRLIRIHGRSLNAQVCCTSCKHAMKNQRNNLRRRVEHARMVCVECGRSFTPKRADAKTCSNRCRQAQHRKHAARNDAGGRRSSSTPRA